MQPRDGVEAELTQLLARADMVKFARAPMDADEARVAGEQLKAIVDHVEARLNPESAPGKRLAAARQKAA
jgi:hypothetical protein